MCVCATLSCLILCDPHELKPVNLLCPWNSPCKNTGVGCHSLLQGIEFTPIVIKIQENKVIRKRKSISNLYFFYPISLRSPSLLSVNSQKYCQLSCEENGLI